MMAGPIEGRPRILLIDSNLLLVLIVGADDPRNIERVKRTRAYTSEDYDLLAAFISDFQQLVVTPNVLTEVSNLAGQVAEPLRTRIFTSLAGIARQRPERYFPSREIAQDPDFLRLGLADISVLMAARENLTVLTDDFPLYHRLATLDLPVVNFNHIRSGSI